MYKLFSERINDTEGNPEVYIYDKFSAQFRNQFFHIFREVERKVNLSIWDYVEIICTYYSREKGMKYLEYRGSKNTIQALEFYIDNCNDMDFLDVMDYILVNWIVNEEILKISDSYSVVERAVKELNYRFKQHSLGYEFINNELIMMKNLISHEFIIKPTLKLLLDEKFRGAEDEYLKAFDCYKKGDNKNAILEAVKSFESTMKIICDNKGYSYDRDRDTASKLISILEYNQFYPSYLSSHITGIRITLESGAPTLRNKKSGHGQGAEVVNLSDKYVEYALNLVSTNIILLYKIFKSHDN